MQEMRCRTRCREAARIAQDFVVSSVTEKLVFAETTYKEEESIYSLRERVFGKLEGQ